MEDVLGGYTDDDQFAAFLGNWEAILARRVAEATAAFSHVNGLHGLILGGGLGRNAPWPLSDIDLIPVFADDRVAAATAEISTRRLTLLPRWIAEGWWSGLDIGRLYVTASEVQAVLQAGDPSLDILLADDRWYHTMDKAFGSCALIDPDGMTGQLTGWITAHRFTPQVVALRLHRERQELHAAQDAFRLAVRCGDLLPATGHLRNAVKWLMTWLLESWGERDNSQGRIGTRFAAAARAHGAEPLVADLYRLSDLAEPQVWRRLAAAPPWVHERHDRSLRARLLTGEAITPLDDARDTLRVCSLYALRRETTPPYPSWLAVLDDATARKRVGALARCIAAIG